jgi:hypothetical protein
VLRKEAFKVLKGICGNWMSNTHFRLLRLQRHSMDGIKCQKLCVICKFSY